MKAVSNYKAMIEELSTMAWIFARFQNNPLKEAAKEQGWTLETISKIQGKVQASMGMADRIKEELIGDGDEAKFVGRIRTAFFELNGKPSFAPSYFPEFDEACFELPGKEHPDRNKELADALLLVYGDEAAMMMVRLGETFRMANFIVQNVCSMLDKVSKFVGYTPEPQQEQRSSQQGQQQEPQQGEQKQNIKPTRGRGRPKDTFIEKMIDDADGSKLQKIHKVIKGKKGKDAALVILACIEKGWMLKPTYTQVKNEFGDIGCNTGYNRYLNTKPFTKEEIEGAKNSLD